MHRQPVADGRSPHNGSPRGETATDRDSRLASAIRGPILFVRFHYLILAPWIVLSVPSQVFLGLGTPIMLAIMAVGLSGALANRQVFATLASVSLLVSLIAGKVGLDLAKASPPDTAVLLLQFLAVIFFMEATRVVLSFDSETRELAGKTDEASQAVKNRLGIWITGQLTTQARLVIGALGLSLVLLVFGGFTNVSINQLAFSAVLVLLVVGALLFLITQEREPETRQASLS